MIKKYSFLMINLLTFFLFSPLVSAAEQDLIVDQANLFSPEQTQEIEKKLQDFHKKTDMTGVVVTTNDAEGKSSRDYADDFYDDNRYGSDERNSGFLLLLDLDNRKIYLSPVGRTIDLLSDRRIEKILDKAVSYMSEKEYAQASLTAIQQINYYYDRDQPGFTPLKMIIACTSGILISIALFVIILSRYQLKVGKYKYPYHQKGTVHLTEQSDIFITSFITTRRIPKNNSGGGGGGSSTHMSGGGTIHGGGGRSF